MANLIKVATVELCCAKLGTLTYAVNSGTTALKLKSDFLKKFRLFRKHGTDPPTICKLQAKFNQIKNFKTV